MRRSIRLFALLTLLASLGAPAALAISGGKEGWVVNGGDNTISVIDLAAQTITRTIPIPAVAGSPALHGITFSTLDDAIGEYAFVAQGDTLYVIEADTGIVGSSFNIADELTRPVTLVDLAAGPSRPFDIQAGGVTIENHLYAAADVRPPGQTTSEPWFVVLDQKVLTGVAPQGAPLVLSSGPLVPPSVPAAERGQASGVTVLGAADGAARERAWFTTRVISPIVTLSRSLRLASDELGSSWAVDEIVETPMQSGIVPAELVQVGAPYDREVPVLPTGLDGRLINLDTGGECVLGGDLRAVALAGPAPGGVQMLVLDAMTDQVHRVNPVTCDFDSFSVAADPVALAIDDIGQYGNAVIVSESSGIVSIMEIDGTISELILPQGAAPKDVAIRKCCDGCTVSGLTVTTLFGDDALNWSKYGCVGCEVQVFCQCETAGDPLCPCYCPPTVPAPPPNAPVGTCYPNLPPAVPSFFFVIGGGVVIIDGSSETPWIHLGNSVTSGYTHTGAAPFGLRYTILPDVP